MSLTQPASFPEHGSTHGVHLRDGRLAGVSGPEPPAFAARGALYCVYPRAFSPRGTLAAVVPQLDRIAALGASALWLLPIHPIGLRARKGSLGSPYAIRDYRTVNPEYGTREDLDALVSAAHARGLKVILDLVVNHAAPDHSLVLERASRALCDADGNPTRRVSDWSDIVDWRFDDAFVVEHLLVSALGWIEAGIDGFRCDVAGMVPLEFWNELRRRMGPEPFLLAEWQDAAHHEHAFHASYDWQLYRALRDVALGEKYALAVGAALRSWQENFPRNAVPLRFVENHDEPRAMAVMGRERLPANLAVAFLSGGLPLIYNGQEAGASHRPSLFEREPVDWHGLEGDLPRLHADLVARAVAWGPGPVSLVETDRPATVVAFTRKTLAGHGAVVANLGRHAETVEVSLPARFAQVNGTGTHEGGALHLAPGEAWIGETQ